MASLWKHPKSRFFTACFRDKNGERRKRSTGLTDRKKAQAVADQFEAIARGKKTMVQVRRVIADLTKDVLDETVEMMGLSEFVKRWVASRKGEVTPATMDFYSGKSQSFLEFMAARGRGDCTLMDVQRADILAWRDAEGEQVASKTVNHALKLLRMIFEAARQDGYIADDPTATVRLLSTSGAKISRRPYSRDEMEVVLRCCDAEWRSMVLFGYYTSHRLGDIARIRWRDLDIEQRKVRFRARKTDTFVNVPMHEDLYDHILSLSTPDDPGAPVHPIALEKILKAPKERTTALSNEFGNILAKAGLRPRNWRQVKKPTKADDPDQPATRKRRREGSEISFHSFRHTIITDLQASGASQQVAGGIAGHSSVVMTRTYTHGDTEAAREAMNKVPAVKRKRKTEQLDLFAEGGE